MALALSTRGLSRCLVTMVQWSLLLANLFFGSKPRLLNGMLGPLSKLQLEAFFGNHKTSQHHEVGQSQFLSLPLKTTMD